MVSRIQFGARRIAIALMFVFAFTTQAVVSWQGFREDLLGYDIAGGPVDWNDNQIIQAVRGPAQAAGVRKGDKLVGVNGQPLNGTSVWFRPLALAKPGDSMSLTVQTGSEPPRTVRVLLEPKQKEPRPVYVWIGILVMRVFTPLFTVLVGFGVLLLRPYERMAWLFMILMVGCGLLYGGASNHAIWGWPAGIRELTLLHRGLALQPWPICMLLFGVYFPYRADFDRRRPWLKWLLIVPLIYDGLIEGIQPVFVPTRWDIAGIMWQWLKPVNTILTALAYFSVSCFFALLFRKLAESTGDSRRRLKLLLTGTGVALTPIFLVQIYATLKNTYLESLPLWVWLPALLLVALFPLTLAYVIVVQRALELQVVIRQGVRYALARGALRVLQALVIMAVLAFAIKAMNSPGSGRLMMIPSGLVAAALVIFVRRAGDRARGWIDRRFFRDAYNAEQILRGLSDSVRNIVETRPLLETVSRSIAQSLHVRSIACLLARNGMFEPAYAVGYPAAPDVVFAADGATPRRLRTAAEALKVYFDDPDSWLYRSAEITEDERERLKRLDAQLLLPLASRDRLLGFLSLGPKQSEEPYSRTDIDLLHSVAVQTGLALENSRLAEAVATEVAQRERMNRELEIAREVQQRLFPQKRPSVPGLAYAGDCRPAQGVGGDYYDFIPLAGNRFGVAIGDVSGKGIPAAMLMASLQASLRGQALVGFPDLALLMENVNRLIYDATPASHFATLFYAQYHPETRVLSWVNAGHNLPLLCRDGQVIRLPRGGVGLGLTRRARYTQDQMQLLPGDVLVCFTDGISEAIDPQGEEWGEERLCALAPRLTAAAPDEIVRAVMSSAEEFASGAPQHDDMTLVVLKVETRG